MAKVSVRNGNGARAAQASRYDAHHTVLSKTYGTLADLRRELADSKAAVGERGDLLRTFSGCVDSQRAWLLLEDYFEKLSLSRKDFPSLDWWPRLLSAQGQARLEELAFLFLRAKRSLPTELTAYANLTRFAQVEQATKERQLIKDLENWLSPSAPPHLDSARAALRVVCQAMPEEDQPGRLRLGVQFYLTRARTGEKLKTLAELLDLMTRAAHEQELFVPADWEFIQWLAENRSERGARGQEADETLILPDVELLHWLARWGQTGRLELNGNTQGAIEFRGEIAELAPHLENGERELAFTHRLVLPGGKSHALSEAQFFQSRPPLALAGNTFYLLRNAPPPDLLAQLTTRPAVPVRKLSHRLLTHLRKNKSNHGLDWEQLCVVHPATPQFIFEILDDSVRLRLLAHSERDRSVWFWNGHEWQCNEPGKRPGDKPELLDDPRLEPAALWLRKLDWFTPKPGLWVGDATEAFLSLLASAWADRPREAEYLGNPGFHRLFLAPRQLRPRLIVKGSGIDWLSVSAEWEQEGLKLTIADLQRLQTATGKFVKLPDGGWMQLDSTAVQAAHETMADLGLDRLNTEPQKVALLHVTQMDEATLQRF